MATPSADPLLRRPRRTAAERRAQKQRSEARVIQKMLRGFSELEAHRGCRPTVLGAALAQVLRSSSTESGSTQRASQQAPPTSPAVAPQQPSTPTASANEADFGDPVLQHLQVLSFQLSILGTAVGALQQQSAAAPGTSRSPPFSAPTAGQVAQRIAEINQRLDAAPQSG